MRRILGRLGTLLLALGVFVYILFEEIVWEGIAEPIITSLRRLRIIQRAESYIGKLNRYLVLLLFLSLFVWVELLGIAAGALFLSGNFLAGTLLYLLKIPIAMFTFWLFRITESKLMKFGWFASVYRHLIWWVQKLKETEIYRHIKKKAHLFRQWIKEKIHTLKNRFFPKKGRFVKRVEYLYTKIKHIFRKTPKN